ncbi:MAG: hypothetical protein IJR89_06285 [Clostridia bacterium]|nr:hypothetical protein [Clostridia bacterium]
MNKKIAAMLSRSCVIFTTIVFFFYLLASAFSEAERPVMDLFTLFSLFAVSVAISFSFLILSSKLPRPLAYLLHFLLCVGSFLFFYAVVLKKAGTGAQVIVALFFSSLLYLLFMVFRALFFRIFKQNKED